MQGTIMEVLQRYMNVPAAGGQEWRGSISHQCEACLYSYCTCSPGESWRSEEMEEWGCHNIISCLLAK